MLPAHVSSNRQRRENGVNYARRRRKTRYWPSRRVPRWGRRVGRPVGGLAVAHCPGSPCQELKARFVSAKKAPTHKNDKPEKRFIMASMGMMRRSSLRTSRLSSALVVVARIPGPLARTSTTTSSLTRAFSSDLSTSHRRSCPGMGIVDYTVEKAEDGLAHTEVQGGRCICPPHAQIYTVSVLEERNKYLSQAHEP